MNVISFNTAYCLYARATLERRLTLVTRPRGYRINAALAKYEARGWTILRRVDAELDVRCFPTVGRSVSDTHTWVLPLDTTGIRQVSHIDPVAATSWHLSHPHPSIHFFLLFSPFLKHTYVLSGNAAMTWYALWRLHREAIARHGLQAPSARE